MGTQGTHHGHLGHKLAEITSRTPEFMAGEASKPFGWEPIHFLEWATVSHMIDAVGLRPPASFIDVGCGSGWASLFLAEAGHGVTGYDLVPANVELARQRAQRWGSRARFEVAEMEALPPGEPVDAALLLGALHHTAHQRQALASIASRLRPGGWLLLGESTWLHRFSPRAHTATRELGWMERGLSLRELKRDLRACGFVDLRRFFQPTEPYEARGRGFAWQLARLTAGNFLVAPRAHWWVAAQLE